MIVELPLDIVLLGSRLGAGPLEVAALAVVTLLWLLFGVWLWRSSASARPGLLAVFYVLPATGLITASLAQDAALFYAGLAAAGYGSLAALLLAHGAGHSRTAAAQATLLVLSDLILFELFVYLYAEAQTVAFDGLRAAYADRGSGLTFVAGLLIFAAGSRIAALFLLLPLSAGLPAWRMGTASALGATAVVAGPLLVVRIVDPSFATSAARYTLSAMLGAALALYLLAVILVRSRAGIDAFKRQLSDTGQRGLSPGVAVLALAGNLSQRLAPRARLAERALLSWPVAVTLASVLSLLLAFAFGSAGSG